MVTWASSWEPPSLLDLSHLQYHAPGRHAAKSLQPGKKRFLLAVQIQWVARLERKVNRFHTKASNGSNIKVKKFKTQNLNVSAIIFWQRSPFFRGLLVLKFIAAVGIFTWPYFLLKQIILKRCLSSTAKTWKMMPFHTSRCYTVYFEHYPGCGYSSKTATTADDVDACEK